MHTYYLCCRKHTDNIGQKKNNNDKLQNVLIMQLKNSRLLKQKSNKKTSWNNT